MIHPSFYRPCRVDIAKVGLAIGSRHSARVDMFES
jgi:hypothetical protein